MQHCNCDSTGPIYERHDLVTRNSELLPTAAAHFLTDGIHTRIGANTFMQDESASFWGFRLYLVENQNDMPLRRVLGHFVFTGDPIDTRAAGAISIKVTPVAQIMDPFHVNAIDITVGAGKKEGDRVVRELSYTATIDVTDSSKKVISTKASNTLWMPPEIPKSWWVERRTVSGTRHSRWCVNLPYMYCQARICSANDVTGEVSCQSWRYEHDGVC